MSTIGASTPRIGTGYTGGPISAGGAGATNNASGYYGQGSGTTGQVANGFNNFVQGGAGLIGTPIRGAARLAGNSLTTTGGAVSNLAQGNLGGAVQSYQTGAQNAMGIVGDTVGQQANNVF